MTAYEMRISDWSSDVCSSDLPHSGAFPLRNLTRAAACFDCVSSPNVHRKISLRRNGRLLELSGFAADDPARAGIDIDDDDLAAVHEFELVEHPSRIELRRAEIGHVVIRRPRTNVGDQIGRAHV